jgi:PTH1 family peptidyl-tRNA hydrolase
MHLIVGLGNPGEKYRKNRHNVGFLVTDRLAERAGNVTFREKFQGVYAKLSVGVDDVVLLKPQTYMNLSGESVGKAMRFFRIPIDRVLVVHDELDLDPEVLRLKRAGGTAGHNGLKSCVKHCGGPGFHRLRVGIGRPKVQRVESYVLGDFDAVATSRLPDVVDEAASMAEMWVREGLDAAMNRYHTRS